MYKRLLLLISIASLFIVLCVCGCTPSETPSVTPTPTPTATPEPTPEPTPTPDPTLKVTDFIVIYPSGKILPSTVLVNAATKLANHIMEKTSAPTYAFDDKLEGFEYEILIGPTNRAESSSVNTDGMKYNDYSITSVGKKLVINGGSDEAVANAVDYLISNILNGELATEGSGIQLLNTSHEYKMEFPYDTFYIDGIYIGDFTLTSTCDASVKDNFIARLLELTGEKIAPGSSAHEIILGESSCEEYTQTVSNKRPGDYYVAVNNGKLIIDGATASDVRAAINYFFSTYFPSSSKTGEITDENDYIHLHPYRYDKLTVNNVDISNFTVMFNPAADATYPDNPIFDPNGAIFSHAFADNIGYWTGVTPKYSSFYQAGRTNSIILQVGNYAECSGLNDRDFIVKVENGNIIISTLTYDGLKSAVSGFADNVLGDDAVVNLTDGMTFNGKFPHPVESITLIGKDISEYVIVTSEDGLLTARLLSRKIAEICGVRLRIVTDSASNYEYAIVLSKSGDQRAKQLLDLTSEKNILAISEGTKIYIGTSSMSYGDAPAVNAFIRDVLGYDTRIGVAKDKNIVVDSINSQALIENYVQDYTVTHYCGISMDWLFNEDGTFNSWRIDEAKAAGFNLIPVGFLPMDRMRTVLDYCNEVGMYCLVHDNRLDSIAHCARNDLEMPKNWMELIDSVVEDYKDYPAVAAYNITDEPSPTAHHNLYQACSYLEYKDPARYQYVNNSGVIWTQNMKEGNSFYNFVLQNGLDFFSYDHYTFMTEDSVIKQTVDDGRISFLSELYMGRLTGIEMDVDTMKIVLLIEHNWGKGTDGYTSYRKLTEEELRWEAMSVVAYGYSALSYFTYRSPGEYDTSGSYWGDAIIKYNGEKSEYYDYVSRINADVLKMGAILYGKQSKEVFYLGELAFTESDSAKDHRTVCFNKFDGYNTINGITYDEELPTGGIIPVSFFEDDMMMIVNDYVSERTFHIDTESSLLMYDCQSGEWIECDGNVTLSAGNGALIKIVK